MYLLWLRVAAILYAGACVAVFPAVFYGRDRWRNICVHVGGMALFFHFVSVVEMLVQAHRWMPVGVREVESLLGFAVAGLF
ncbi:MAG: cytochrome C biogenesis protein, partial [Acidobacteriota bacterium]|nr:cytochrome C biogenesis protein [Acidobacteriota bacterium]